VRLKVADIEHTGGPSKMMARKAGQKKAPEMIWKYLLLRNDPHNKPSD